MTKYSSLKTRLTLDLEQRKIKQEIIVNDNDIVDGIVFKIPQDQDFDKALAHIIEHIQTPENDKLVRDTAIDFLRKREDDFQ